jgi:DivIVA domain-containing protein
MLSTDELTSTRFTATRAREGYEMSEVDEFLEHITETLRRRDEEVRDLRQQLLRATERAGDQGGAQPTPDTTAAVTRLLELAARNADELMAEVQVEAASLRESTQADVQEMLASARADAERMVAGAQEQADELVSAARAESEGVLTRLEEKRADEVAELNRHRTAVLSEVAGRKAALEAEVARLEQLENDFRTRMRGYLTEQLAELGEPTDNGGDQAA